MILHGFSRSSTAWRCRIALNLKGLDVESRNIDLLKAEQRSADYLALNPQGLVPSLEVGGMVLTQSLAIIEWIDETYPQFPLLPEDKDLRAQVRAFAQVIACDIHPLQNLRVLKHLKNVHGADQAARDAWCRTWLRSGLETCEIIARRHRHMGPFTFGDQPSLADVCLIPQLAAAARFHLDIGDFVRLNEIRAECEKIEAFWDSHPDNQPGN